MASVGPPLLVWVVEVGQDVPGSAFECPAQGGELGEGGGHACGVEASDFLVHQSLSPTRVG